MPRWLPLLIGGAIGAALGLFTGRRPWISLTLLSTSVLETGWERALAGVNGVSLFVARGPEPQRPEATARLAAKIRRLGLTVEAWAYVTATDVESARAEARLHVAHARAIGARKLDVNAERHVAAASDPRAVLRAYFLAAREAGAGLELWFNGYSRFYEHVTDLADGFLPMCYGLGAAAKASPAARRAQIAAELRARAAQWRAAGSRGKWGWMVGAGRPDGVTHAGYWHGPEGLIALYLEHRPDRIAFFYNGAGDLLTTPSGPNPRIADGVAALRKGRIHA